MAGRAKGDQERIIILAHQIEMFARQKTLREVSHYLGSKEDSREVGAAKVLALFRRLEAKGKQDV